MRFEPASLNDAWIIDLDPNTDERGFFARSYAVEAFEARNLNTTWPHWNTAWTRQAGTIRGLHWQEPPHGDIKLVHCTRGAIFQVFVDVRPHSTTYGQHASVELSVENRRMLYVPEGFALGYQTLVDDSDVFYAVGTPYAPHAERGLRWDDPAFRIAWPLEPTEISEKDTSHADFDLSAYRWPEPTQQIAESPA